MTPQVETEAKAVACGPLMIPVSRVAELTSLGERTIWRLSGLGHMPAPLKVGGRRLWRFAEIRDWVAAGCPTSVKGE